MQESTFTPTNPLQGQTLEQILEGEDGVFGATGEESTPKYVVIQGVCFQRNLDTGDFEERVTASPAERRFFRITGELTLTMSS